MNLVDPMWKTLMDNKEKIQLKVETLIREKEREIAAVRRKVEWEMNGMILPVTTTIRMP